jgi:hypothetical protein
MLVRQVFAESSGPLTTHSAFTSWQAAPVVTAAVAALALLHLAGVIRVRRRHPARPWPWLRLSAQGVAALKHPNSVDDWTVPQAVSVVGWLLNRDLAPLS